MAVSNTHTHTHSREWIPSGDGHEKARLVVANRYRITQTEWRPLPDGRPYIFPALSILVDDMEKKKTNLFPTSFLRVVVVVVGQKKTKVKSFGEEVNACGSRELPLNVSILKEKKGKEEKRRRDLMGGSGH